MWKIRPIALWEDKGDRILGRKGRSQLGKIRAIVVWENKADRTFPSSSIAIMTIGQKIST
ncbi:hypothetical protein [Tychonema sp. BBK16]|uniref:hypothetical protein n=1 Tax=Tychonema sp. BBK16 TaxID=2699888 RepID=UPI001F1BA2ED|nr:hypothetical protein [Tychonema sp. BBK16]MCF6375639.1 hypothetical protein [Tychonema sp. BBK16]